MACRCQERREAIARAVGAKSVKTTVKEARFVVRSMAEDAGIHGGAVTFVTGSIWLGLAEWAAHTVIDELKVRQHTSFAVDQALHIACKAVWLAILLLI